MCCLVLLVGSVKQQTNQEALSMSVLGPHWSTHARDPLRPAPSYPNNHDHFDCRHLIKYFPIESPAESETALKPLLPLMVVLLLSSWSLMFVKSSKVVRSDDGWSSHAHILSTEWVGVLMGFDKDPEMYQDFESKKDMLSFGLVPPGCLSSGHSLPLSHTLTHPHSLTHLSLIWWRSLWTVNV